MYCRPVRRPLRVRELENRCRELERKNAFLIDNLIEAYSKTAPEYLLKANEALMGEVEYLRKRLSSIRAALEV